MEQDRPLHYRPAQARAMEQDRSLHYRPAQAREGVPMSVSPGWSHGGTWCPRWGTWGGEGPGKHLPARSQALRLSGSQAPSIPLDP